MGDNPQIQHAQREVRKVRALEMRVAGMTLQQIGTELGVSKVSAHRYVRAALDDCAKLTEKDAERLLVLELERLDKLQRTCERMMSKPGHELAAADRLLRIAESRRRLLGVDAPEKSESADQLRIVVEYGDVDEDA
jgi:hypothetical protein